MDTGKIILGTIAGFAAGALVGVLFAPHKGSVTRRKLTQKSTGYVEDLREKFDEFVDDMTNRFEALSAEEKDLAEKVKDKKPDHIRKTVKSNMS